MNHSARLRHDARTIWQAGVDAVQSEKLVRDVVWQSGDQLIVCGHGMSLARLNRIVVVGAGKAGAGMAAAVEQVLGTGPVAEKVSGWVNVPADCVRSLRKIHLHAARPAAVNEPTTEGVEGAEQILRMVSDLGPDDLCLVLLSGGGSALLPAPIPPLTLADKQAVTRFLMRSGATINQLNAVRKRLSRIKGGGLARASSAGQTITLIISDIVGDPLDMIASGPTCPDSTTDAEALRILRDFKAAPPDVPQAVLDFLQAASDQPKQAGEPGMDDAYTTALPRPNVRNGSARIPRNVVNHIIGNNQTALAAAGRRAQSLGYHVILLGSDNLGETNQMGRALAERCRRLRDGDERGQLLPVCLLSGGEPIVRLAETDLPRKGGRNQQLVLAGLQHLWEPGLQRIALLSGGTDGEDGPTDAAGAFADEPLWRLARDKQLEPRTYLDINDAYGYFQQLDGLLRTGPTHTNVMDLRVALVEAPNPK